MVGKQLLGAGERINKGVHGTSSTLGVMWPAGGRPGTTYIAE